MVIARHSVKGKSLPEGTHREVIVRGKRTSVVASVLKNGAGSL